jgi:hypothetical protein
MEHSLKKSELSWKTDKHGIVMGAHDHDGKIIGLSFAGENASVQVRRIDGSIIEFELGGLDEWNSELCNGAIVSEIYVWKVDSVPEDCWQIPDSGWNALYGSRYKPEDIKIRAEKIKKKREA